MTLSAVMKYRKDRRLRLQFGMPTRALDDDFAPEDVALEREREKNCRNSTRQANSRERMPPPQDKKPTPPTTSDPELAAFGTPMDCMIAAALVFKGLKITGHPG